MRFVRLLRSTYRSLRRHVVRHFGILYRWPTRSTALHHCKQSGGVAGLHAAQSRVYVLIMQSCPWLQQVPRGRKAALLPPLPSKSDDGAWNSLTKLSDHQMILLPAGALQW